MEIYSNIVEYTLVINDTNVACVEKALQTAAVVTNIVLSMMKTISGTTAAVAFLVVIKRIPKADGS